MTLIAMPPEVCQIMLEEMYAALEKPIPDPGPEGYNTKRENGKRELMKTLAFYAEEGPTWDPEGKYLCESCYYRQLMDWGDTPACYVVQGDISMETGTCQFYRYGDPDSESNPLPMAERYTKAAANYAERPKAKGFGCYPRCEYGAVAEGKDPEGREIWCGQFGVHVRPKACCAFEDGDDLVQIEAGGLGSGCNPEVGKCGRPKGPDEVTTAPTVEQKQENQILKESKWRQYNPNAVGGYFRQGTAIATIYQSLIEKEGQWRSVAEIKKSLEGKTTANIDNRFIELKYTGKRSGRWQVEISGDNARIFLKKTGDIKPFEMSDDKQALAANLAKDFIALQKKGFYEDEMGTQSKALFSKYYEQMGVTDLSRKSMELAIRLWTGSVDEYEPQKWRQVAMMQYNRTPEDEYAGSYMKKIGKPETVAAAENMKPAVMAMKAYASEYARQHDVTTVYRGVGGELARNIVKALVSGQTKIAVNVNSLSSWSSDKYKASGFGTVLLRMKIDPDNVWAAHQATPWLFSAHSKESEYVIGMHNAKETFDVADIKVTSPAAHHLNEENIKKFANKVFAEKEEVEDQKPFLVEGHFDEDWLHREEKKK